jgi:excinuclease ABC subunit A
MSKRGAGPAIRLRGVRHNNLKNFNLDLPLGQLIVITGLSGSGKSSLAFDTLFAEGQRRYIETFSPYARQFFERMDKPQVDSIEGIPPAIAIEQRNTVRTTRSTVGTMTEICDYAKLIWFHLGRLHCRGCGKPVQKDSPQFVWDTVRLDSNNAAVLISFELPLTEKISIEETIALIARQGYQRVVVDGGVMRLEESPAKFKERPPASIEVIQDRVTLVPANRSRFIEACEQAYHFGKGRLSVCPVANGGRIEAAQARRFSNRLHCAACDIEYREPSAALFSFNHPLGACPECRGFGRTVAIDYNRAVPDRSKTLAEGAVKPWQTGQGAECQQDLMKFCRKRRVPVDVPVRELPGEMQDWLLYGDPDYGKDDEHQWPRAWYGVKG